MRGISAFFNSSLESLLSGIDLKAPRIYNLPGSSLALLLSLIKKPFVLITGTEEEAIRHHGDIISLTGFSSGKTVFITCRNQTV